MGEGETTSISGLAGTPRDKGHAPLFAGGEAVFNTVVYRMLYALAPLTVLWLIGSVVRVRQIGWHPILMLEVAAAAMVGLSFLFRKRINPRRMAVSFISSLGFLSCCGLISFGLLSAGAMMGLVGAAVLCVTVYGRTAGLIAVLCGIALLAGTAFGIHAGVLPLFVGSLEQYAASPFAWLAAASNLMLVAGVLVLSISTIQERMAAAAAAAESEFQFTDTVLNAQHDLFVVFEPETRKVIRWNHVLRELTGLTDEEISQRRVPDGWDGIIDVADFRAALDRLLGGSTSCFETVLKAADGRTVPLEFRGMVTQNDALGGAVVVGVGRDLTARRAAEQALRESEERFRLLLDSVPTVIWTANTAGHPLYVSPNVETLHGYTAEEIVQGGLPFLLQRIHEDDREAVRNAYLATVFHRQPHECQFRFQIKDGRWLWIHHHAAPVRLDAAGAEAVCGMWSDVTEQVSSLEKLHQAEKMQAVGQLAGGVAHDFNNQLMAITGCIELLAREAGGNPRMMKYIHHICDCTGFASSLTDRLLAFSRKTAERVNPLNTHRVMEQTAFILERSIPADIRVRLALDAADSTISADISRLQSAVLNLCLNARDAMPDGGDLTLSSSNVTFTGQAGEPAAPGEYLCIQVSDTGTGMDDAVKERVFEPFFTTKSEGKGTGLGLSGVRNFAENRKGAVTLESTLGKGTVVSLFLPLAKLPSSASVQEKQHRNFGDDRKGNILLVDDETEVSKTIAAMLEEFGYRVKRCESGRTAVDQYRLNPTGVDLVILDWVMPEFGGEETFSALREINEDIKVLLASARVSQDDLRTALESGAAGYIEKPFSAEELEKKVGAALHAV